MMHPNFFKSIRYTLQLIAFVIFASIVGFFSASPLYQQITDDQTVLKLSLSHSAPLKFACVERSNEELAKLEPHMRNRLNCPRERSPITVELHMDGQLLWRETALPQGLHKDGPATVYHRLIIPSGSHSFQANLIDGTSGLINFTSKHQAQLSTGQVLIVDFQMGKGGFVFTGG